MANMAKNALSTLTALVCVQLVINPSVLGEDVQCNKPPELERSRPCEKDEEFPVGKTVKYCCNPGFRPSGVRTVTCKVNSDGIAEWTDPKFQCQAVSCSAPDLIENGRIVGSRYTFPNSVKYECNKGYKLAGLSKRFCETTGEWSGREPRCEVVTCPVPEEIENGKVTYPSTKYLSTANYECVSGYRIEGRNKRQCTHEGEWEGNIPACIEVVCPEPNNPIGGKVIAHSGRRKDSLIYFTCSEGTELIGASSARCTEDGTWSSEAPLCAKPCVVPKLNRGRLGKQERKWTRSGSYVTFVETRHRTLQHGEMLMLRCNDGYELPVEDLKPGDIEVVCEGGAFNPQPACHPVWCRQPLPDNGRGTPPSPPYSKEDGSVVEYQDPCAGVGEVLKKKTAKCNGGRWIVTDEECHDFRCKAKDLEGVSFEEEFYPDGEQLEFQCKEGYDKVIEAWILCSRGQWQIPRRPCQPAPCGYSPPAINNGKFEVSSYDHGGTVEYSCFPPYQLVSREPVTCSYGQWDGTIPSCADEPCKIPYLYHGKMGVKTPGRTHGSTQFYKKEPGTPIQPGEKLLLHCDEEYELPIDDLPPGDVEVVCEGGGFKPKPSCHPAWCRGPLPDNGKGIPPSPPYDKENGSVVQYQDGCLNIGRTLQEKTALCYRGTWIVQDEKCEDVRCKAKELEGFNLDTKGEEFFNNGDVVNLPCKIGYEQISENRIPCIDGQWQVKSPPCKSESCKYSPPGIDNGEFEVTSYEHGVNVNYSCFPPYQLVSRGPVTCANGQWDGTLPSCENQPCEVPYLYRGEMGVKEDGSKRFEKREPRTSVQPGGKLWLRCNEEFELPVEDLPSGDIEVVCEGGAFKPEPACHPAWCRGPLPDNGKGIPPSPPYNKENGSVVQYEDACLNIGRTLQEKTALCLRGKWIVRNETCEDSRCKAIELEAFNVEVKGKEFFSDGEEAILPCKVGYEKTSEDGIPCSNGQWEIREAPCKPAYCRYSPPDIEHGKATVSSGEHGSSVNYNCFPPYELVSKGSVACSHGQWTGNLPVCKDTRCSTHDLSVYEGVKPENKTIKNAGTYTPTCYDGYEHAGIELICNKGTWGHGERRNPKFCKPGDCRVPYVAYGDFYFLEISHSFWTGETRELKRVHVDSTAKHNAKLHFKCQGNRKFQGTTKTDGEGVQVTCKLKQWIPKPECWFFPQTTTAAPTTTEPKDEVRLNSHELNLTLENNTIINDTFENDKDSGVTGAVPNITQQNYRNSCKYDNRDAHLLIFFDDQVTSNGILPDESIVKYGCQPIGSLRLQGPTSAVCSNGEWKPSDLPTCVHPERITISLTTTGTYETRPGDVAVVENGILVDMSCRDLYDQSRHPPRFYHSDASKNITSSELTLTNGMKISWIRIENMREKYSGTYICSSGRDSHRITLALEGSQGSSCRSLDVTDGLLINYKPEGQRVLPGTRATFNCKEVMLELVGVNEVTCLKNGNWSSSPPKCVRRCWPLPGIGNGYKDGDSSTVGSVVSFRCRKGFKLSGRSKLTCQEDGLWSDRPPICSEIRCPVPAKIANGNTEYSSLRFDARIEYKCSEDYELVGNKISRCNENGQWTNEPPVCKEKSKGCSSYDLIDNLQENVFGENLTSNNMAVESVIRLACGHDSQVIVGDKYAFCMPGGYWKVGNTKCVIGCSPVKKPDNSTLIIEGVKDTYTFGDSVTFSCPKGYRSSMDLEQILCLGTGWSDDRVPDCIPKNRN